MLSKEFYLLQEERRKMTPGPGLAAAGRSIPDDVRFEDGNLAGRHIIRAVPLDFPEDKVILHFHGGGFVGGSAEMKKFFYGEIARRCHVKVISGDYRLLPETYPAALDDCYAIYSALLSEEGYDPSNIILFGESAGGVLAMATVLKCKAEHTPLPLGLAVLSSTMIDGTDALKAYAGTASIEDPLVNPVLGDFNGLRHMFAQMGANEASIGDPIKLLERSNQFAARMALSTVKFEYHIGAGLDHVFSEDFSLYPEADEGFEQLLEFLSRTLNLTEQK